MRDIHLTFGGTPLLVGAELSVSEGERLCFVGRNGSGKSTLLKIAAGLIQSDTGDRVVQTGTTIRYLPQEPDLSAYASTLAYVEDGMGGGDDLYRARYLLEELGMTGNEDPKNLSGGEGRRAALARVLAPEPDVILLDEPTNHLDLPAIEWLEAELKSIRSALVIISHDRRFLENLSQATVWLDRGATRRIDRGFASFESWRDTVLEEEERDGHKLDRKIAMEQDWVRYGVSGRRKRNMRRLGELGDMREKRRTERRVQGNVKLTASTSETSGKLVVEAIGIGKSYGERPIVKDFSIRVARGDRIGIVGPNGAGKTTLISMITGALQPDTGTIRIGANVEMVTLDQKREGLSADTTLTEALTGGRSDQVMVGGQPKHVISYMKDFLFTAEQIRTPVSVLSGGERGRLMLARALAKPSNMLVLDEPTNDLDLETLDLLQEMIADYQGTVLLVSHDRDFLDRVVTSVVAYEGEARWTEYAGGYSDMVAQRGVGVQARKADKSELAAKAVKSASGATAAAAGGGANAARKKLSFKDQHALKTLPDRIEALNAEIVTLQAKMAAPDLYSRDPAGFAKLAAALAKAQAAQTACEDEWLALEMMREELEA